MVRPRKRRYLRHWPAALGFEPRADDAARNGPGTAEPVLLELDELEVLRLADFEGLDQTDCADEMGVSQSTVQRMLRTARHKVAEALVTGKPLRIRTEQASALLAQQLATIQAQMGYLKAWLEELEDDDSR